MRFLFATTGSDGDFLPLVRTALVLKHEGHEVVFITQDTAEDWMRSQGFEYEMMLTKEEGQLGLDIIFADYGQNTLAEVWDKNLEPMTRRMLEAVKKWYRKDDTILIAQARLPGGRLAREVLGIPLISVNLTPWCFDYFVEFTPEQTNEALQKPIELLRKEFSLPPMTQSVYDWCYSDQLVLAMFPDWFAPTQPHWNGPVKHTDFLVCIPEMEAPLDQDVLEFLEQHPEPIVFTYGTFNLMSTAFIEKVEETCAYLQKAAIVLAWKEPVPENLPDHILLKTRANLPELLPKVSLFVNHSGIGTVAEGIRCGVPQIGIPHLPQQRAIGEAVAKLNLGFCFKLEDMAKQTTLPFFEKAIASPSVRSACEQHKNAFEGFQPWYKAAKLVFDFAKENLSSKN